jgi:hypothetical protein
MNALVKRLGIAVILILTAGLVAAPQASGVAQTGTLEMTPNPAQIGTPVSVRAWCGRRGPAGPATSPGFAAPVWVGMDSGGIYTGTGTVGDRQGQFTVSFPCPQGTTLTSAFTVLARTAPPTTGQGTLTITPRTVEPGGMITAAVSIQMAAPQPMTGVTSAGLAAPIELMRNEGGFGGAGRVGTTPGRFTARVTLVNGTNGPFTLEATFTVRLNTPPPSTSGGHQAQVPAVPSGGVETGDGSVADPFDTNGVR